MVGWSSATNSYGYRMLLGKELQEILSCMWKLSYHQKSKGDNFIVKLPV